MLDAESIGEVIVAAPEEVIAHLETECARMAPVVAAAMEWSKTSDATLRLRAEQRLRYVLSAFAARRMVS